MEVKKYLDKNPKKHIIIDFDDTLVSMNLPWRKFSEMRHEALMKEGIDYFEPKSRRYLDVEGINEPIKEIGEKAWEIEREVSKDFEMNNLDGYNTNKDLLGFITNSGKEYTFYIWSSNTEIRIKTILEELELEDRFEEIISKDDVELMKPEPEGFYMIFDETKHTKKDFLFYGNNSHSDKLAAKNAGIDFLLAEYF